MGVSDAAAETWARRALQVDVVARRAAAMLWILIAWGVSTHLPPLGLVAAPMVVWQLFTAHRQAARAHVGWDDPYARYETSMLVVLGVVGRLLWLSPFLWLWTVTWPAVGRWHITSGALALASVVVVAMAVPSLLPRRAIQTTGSDQPGEG